MARLRFSPAARERCEAIVARYPERRAALLPVLLLARREFGECSPEVVGFVAELLELPPAHVTEVASFYPQLRDGVRARHTLRVCAGLSCRLGGANEVAQVLSERLGIGEGQASDDGEIALQRCECLGACATAPVLDLEGDIHTSLTRRLLEQLLERLGR